MSKQPESRPWYAATYWRHHGHYMEWSHHIDDLVGHMESMSDYNTGAPDGYWKLTDGEWVEIDVADHIEVYEERSRAAMQQRIDDGRSKPWRLVVLGPGDVWEIWSDYHTEAEAIADQDHPDIAGLPMEVRRK